MIAHLIRLYRQEHKMSVRMLAREMGIGFTVLYRFENGHPVDSSNWVKILRWILGEEM